MTFLSSRQIPEANFAYRDGLGLRRFRSPILAAAQVLAHDQLVLFIGMDPETPQGLGATVELYLGGTIHCFEPHQLGIYSQGDALRPGGT